MFVTDFAQQLKTGLPPALQHLQLPSGGRANAVVCLAQWRDSSSKGSSYDRLSALVAALVKLWDCLGSTEMGGLIDVMTFRIVDQKIANSLCERVKNTADTINADEVRAIATRRQAGHWASLSVSGAPEVLRKPLHAVFDALVAASEFFALRNQHQSSFDFADAAGLYRAYEKELYRYDQLYRHFCESADDAEAEGWDVLKSLRESLEACYANWYLPTLGLSWGKFVEPASQLPLLTHWRIDEVPSQQQFFEEHVRRRLEEAENRKVYVIISDAFRYEAAEELSRELNGKYRFEASLTSQLGVLPSYTALGMASLLPHKKLAYKANGEVLVDDLPTVTLEDRNDILAARSGMTCKPTDLTERKKDEGREFVSGKRVVYIYHNTIDATGESNITEGRTFHAVRTAINELASLVSYIINNLNGNFILITADHGFLFTETTPGEPEKSKVQQKPEGTVQLKKRYLIGQDLPDHESVWHGRTSITAEAEGDMEFWIPKAANRFHFLGGGRFIHGGAMPQEIVVPLITVRHVKGKSIKDTTTKFVTVHVLGSSHKITTNRHRFELIQMEPVTERVKPVTLKVAIYEGDEPVTNIEAVTFDSASDKMEDRRKWVPLVLRDRQYNKKTSYYLILRDSKTNLEQQRVEVTIDKAFSDDF
ncbi:MAG: BREX-1 system phosphatase PglZ type A [Acidobacteria bacterium]|nr:BREX-1 system phosphatase PglZ type A [Acidobacteriota bacterium]